MKTIQSFNERIISLPDYSAPLRVISFDAFDSKGKSYDFHDELENIFCLPKRQVMEFEDWLNITRSIRVILEDEEFRTWRNNSNYNEDYADSIKDSFIKKIVDFTENPILFSVTAVRNIVYLASEGSFVDIYEDYSYGVDKLIKRFVYDQMVVNEKLGHDKFSFWVKTTNLLLQPISNDFKQAFNDVASYQIPFGLSPDINSFTIEKLFEHSKKVAIVPLIQGVSEVGSAITQNNWGVAIEAAAASGAVVVILISSISISEKIYQWTKKKNDK